MNCMIRDAVSLDRPNLVHMMADLQNFERTLHPNRSDGWAIASAHLAYLEQQVQEHHGRLLVAEGGAGIMGFLVCFVESLDDADMHVIRSEHRFGTVSDLYVVEQMRGRGVGTALLRAAEHHFKALGLSTVRVTTLSSNKSAQQIYQSSGYKPYEITYEKSI